MSKLTLDALKQRADAVATDELLGQISGGTENSCHTDIDYSAYGHGAGDIQLVPDMDNGGN